MSNLPKGIPAGPLDALAVFNTIKQSVDEYVRVSGEETTKRAEIRAKADVAIGHIEGQTQVLVTYLKLAHDSRADFFEKSFAALDSALEKGELGTVTEILGSITDVAKKSAFADLKDLGDVRRVWADPDAEFEV